MTALQTYAHELVVYVVWHPDFLAGKSLASFVYDHLTRGSNIPLTRGMGIPVYVRTAVDSQSVPETIPFGEAVQTVVVLLVDDKMVLGRNQGWDRYVQATIDGSKIGAGHVLPVKVSANAFSLNAQLRNANFLPLDTVATESRPQRLLIGLVHDLCRLLQHEPALDFSGSIPNANPKLIAKPIRIFISHAKKDGEALALKIRDYISTTLQLDTFFDKNQIYYAEDFASVLEQNVEQSALLVLQTDAYSTREWCQREVIVAKRHGRPILVLHKVDVGEPRSFPYLGNLPVLQFRDEMPIDEIIGKLMLEVLRIEYFPKHVRGLARLFGKSLSDLTILTRTPELLDVSRKHVGKTMLYPDPPVGRHEVETLCDFHDGCRLTTLLFWLAGEPSLAGLLVGLSLSSIAPDSTLDAALQKLGFLRSHIDDALAEIACFLLAGGADLAYGGDLRPGGFTEKLHDLVRLYSDPSGGPQRLRVRNFLAWVAHVGKEDNVLQFMNFLDPELLPLPEDVVAELGLDSQYRSEPPSFAVNTPESNYLNARCFTAMREAMNDRIAARVMLGGTFAGYAGKYPGIVEEMDLAIRAKKPVYLIGAFGGCTRALIDVLEGQNSADLTLAGQLQLDEDFRKKYAQQDRTPYQQRVDDFNRRAATNPGVEPIDIDSLLSRLSAHGTAGVARDNGLTVEENRRLFVTTNVREMVYFVLVGLNRLKQQNRLPSGL
jgi:SLOG cluster2/TIR domain